jgi:hypothetical protein
MAKKKGRPNFKKNKLIKRPNIGNETFSINTDKFDNNLYGSNTKFFMYYIFITFIVFYFLFSMKIQTYKIQDYIDRIIENRFKDFSHSIFNHFQPIQFEYYKNHQAVGFTFQTYLFLTIFILIGYLLLLKKMIGANIYQMFFGGVQINKNVNPYKNPRTVSKIDKSPVQDSYLLYSKYVMISLLFLIPIGVHSIIQMMDVTQRDVEKNVYIRLFIFGTIILGTFYIIIQSIINRKSLDVLLTGKKYMEDKDEKCINEMNQELNLQYFTFYLPIFFIIFIFSIFSILYQELHQNKYLTYFSYFLIFILIPFFSIFLANDILYKDYQDPKLCKKNGYSTDIEVAVKRGIQNFYQAVVKYNFPCFYK